MRLVTKVLVRFTNDNCPEQNATMSCIFEGSELASKFGVNEKSVLAGPSKKSARKPVPIRRSETEMVNYVYIDKDLLKKVLDEEIGHLEEDEGAFDRNDEPVMFLPAAGVAMQSMLNFIRATEEMYEKEYADFKDDPDDENGENGFNPPPSHSLKVKVYLLIAKKD